MYEKKFLIKTRENKQLHAILYQNELSNKKQAKQHRPLVIMCHGFTGDKYEWGRFPKTAKELTKGGFDVLIFDFSGSGENQRECITLSKQVRDLKSVHKWVLDHNYIKVALLGLSFGGLTVLVANLPDITTLIFWAPGFYVQELVNTKPFRNSLLKKPLSLKSSGEVDDIVIDISFINDLTSYNPEKYLENLHIPCLIIQGEKDITVNPKQTKKAFDIIPNTTKKKLIIVENANHDFSESQLEEFIDQSANWLDSIFKRIK